MFEDFMEQCLGIHNKKLQKELSDVAKLRTFFKGENLIRVEDKTKEVFLLMDGIVRGYFLRDDGRDFTDCFCFRAGTPITGGGGTDMPAKLNMEALSKVFVLGLPVSAVRELMKKYPELVRIQNCFFREFLEEHLENIDINILRNHDYASGVKTSIRLGLKSVPSSCDGALLIPADMPNITAEYLNRMIKSFNKGKERQLLVSAYGGHKYNPVLWSSDLYPTADLVPEDSHLRQVFLEHSDYLSLVESDAETCLDVNFPNDLELLTKDGEEASSAAPAAKP